MRWPGGSPNCTTEAIALISADRTNLGLNRGPPPHRRSIPMVQLTGEHKYKFLFSALAEPCVFRLG